MLVTCVGDLVFDAFAVNLPRISPPGRVTFAPSGIEIGVGGHSANVSINLRRVGLKKGEVSSIGAIGQDILGSYIERKLRKEGVLLNLQRISGVGTSKDLVLVVKGEDRRYHVDPGANAYLSSDFVVSSFSKEKPYILYVGGAGGLGEFDDKLKQVLARTKGEKTLSFVDPSSPLSGRWDFLINSLRWIDILHCNDDEASDITGENDPVTAAQILRKKGVSVVIVSLGEKGLVAATRKITLEMPAFRVKAIDPSGAGDAFVAGAIYGLTRIVPRPQKISDLAREHIMDVLVEGAATGAACVTGIGTTLAVTRRSIDQLLRSQEQKIRDRTRILPD